jgi:hypothetical protein
MKIRSDESKKQEKREQEMAEQLEALKASGADGYYEYKVLKMEDNARAGCLDAEELMYTLNTMGLQGWRLVNAYSNELGKNNIALNGFGTNATNDEHIMIFERFRKF